MSIIKKIIEFFKPKKEKEKEIEIIEEDEEEVDNQEKNDNIPTEE